MNCPACNADNDDAAARCQSCGQLLSLGPGALVAGRYEILGVLGEGGMGMVYKAHDRSLEETVALKVLRPNFAQTPEADRRFRSEIKLARKVTHRNVCRIHEYGEDGPLRYLSMEFVDGINLKQAARGGQVNPPYTQLPDWSGLWTQGGGGSFFGTAPGGAMPKLTPAAAAALKLGSELVAKGVEYDENLSECGPPGFPRWLVIPFLREFIVRPEQTWLSSETVNNVRRIYTDGRAHPPISCSWSSTPARRSSPKTSVSCPTRPRFVGSSWRTSAI